MQYDPRDDEGPQGVRRAEGEQPVPDDPGGHGDQQHALHAEPAEEEGHAQHQQHLGKLAERLRPRDVRKPRRGQVQLREIVVEGQRDAQEQGAEDEQVEGPASQFLQGVQSDHRPERRLPSGGRRRRSAEREAVESHDQAGRARRVERPGRLFRNDLTGEETQDEADEEARGDPADRAEHPDQRILRFPVLDAVKGDGVHQAQGRHVADIEDEQEEDEEQRGIYGQGHEQHDAAGQDMQPAQDPFGREIPVRDQAQEEGGDDRGHRVHRIGPVGEVLHPVGAHVDRDRGIPAPPDEELEEHHEAEGW